MAFYIKEQPNGRGEKFNDLSANDKNLLNEYFKIEKFYRYALKEMQAKIKKVL